MHTQGTGEAVGLLSEEAQDEDEEEGEAEGHRDEEEELRSPEASLPKAKPKKGKEVELQRLWEEGKEKGRGGGEEKKTSCT